MMLRRTTLLAAGLTLLSTAVAWSQVAYAPSSLGAPPGPGAPGMYGPAWNAPPQGMALPGQMPYGVMPAAYQPPMADAGGMPMPTAPMQAPMQSVLPSGAPMEQGPPPGDPNAYYGGGPGAPGGEYCGAGSCGGGEECGEFDSGFRNMLFPEKGCAPRWYNISAEFLLLKRETGAGTADYASDGISGPIVLSAEQFEFTEEPGVKVTWQTVMGPGDALDFTYLGAFFYGDSAEVTSNTNNLFTAFSDFGNTPFGGFSDTDAASLLRTDYESRLNSLELNYRYRWVSPNNRINNSLLVGVRWVRLSEEFRFQGQTATGNFDYQLDTINNDVGMQLGFDLYVNVFRRLTLGGEVKAGLYGNDCIQHTSIAATTVNPTYTEELHKTKCSFVSEANFMAIARVTSHLTVKGGYELLFIDRVALASDNFNPEPIFLGGGRTPTLNTGGEAFYHGLTAGFEWTW